MVRQKTCRKRVVAARGHGLFSVLLLCVTVSPLAMAGPDDGQVVGGSGSIAQAGNTTTINQTSQNMAIDWQSYNVNTNERVQYIQPNSSSISLNRILSQSGSTIAGRIDANGQVILVNPNGVFFTATSIINVGGIIASGLDIQPNDFMNGRYIFDEVLGTEGTVINSGMINASLGGNVALIGKQVENDGLIVANLGSVTLAAGKQAVLTFDQGGLLGVRVSKEILQEELGVDPAVINSGEIQAEGGRVLLSASTSRDVFSQAVNTGDLEQATSVVVHEDGSFTLGGGADVINTGSIDTSTTANDQDAGRIVLIGENVTSSGELRADAANGNAGEIELHAQDTTLLTANSLTSARSEREGRGGTVKVLGDNVGLFDQSVVDASGAHGGGRIFIGGDQEGNNPFIPNAEFIYLSEKSQVFADALDNGDGGRLITFAADTARIYGDLFARGGINGGDGGFIETSGLIGFQIAGAPDASSYQGEAGTWLIDPYNITVTNSRNNASTSSPFVPSGEDARIHVSDIRDALLGTDVIIRTRGEAGAGSNGDITFDRDGDLNYNGTGTTRTLMLDAAGDITFEAGSRIFDEGSNTPDSLKVELLAAGAVILEGAVGGQVAASITTQGGDFVVGDSDNSIIPTSFTNNGTITTTGGQNQDGGNITIYTSGTLTSTGLTANGGAAGNDAIGRAAGAVTLNAGTGITLTGPVTATGSQGDHGYDSGAGGAVLMTSTTGAIDIQAGIDTSGGHGDGDNDNHSASGGDAGSVGITADNGAVTVSTITANGGNSAGNDSDNSRRAGNGGIITISGSGITLNNNLFSIGGMDSESNAGNGAAITLNGPVTLANSIILDARGAIRGDIDFNGTLDGTTARAEDLTLYGRGITFSGSAGGGTRLGDLLIDVTGVVDAAAHSITASSLDVQNSNRFTSGAINTAGDTTGGSVTIGSGDIVVGAINTSATDIGGAITLDATDNTSGGTPSITLNGDINASGATEGAVAMNLNGSDSPTGSVTLNIISDFTTAVTLTGSSGTDTLTAANRPNNWSLSATDSVLNDNFTFSGIETLTGNAQTDRFILPNSGEFSGTLYGGGGVDEIQAGNRANSWNINADGVGTVTGLNTTFNEIERLKGNDNNDDFTLLAAGSISGTIDGGGGTNTLIGRDGNTTWTISVAGNSLAATSSGNDYVNAFINIDTLRGGTGSDIFNLGAGISGSVNGGQGDDTFNIDTPGLTLTNLRGGTGSDTLNGNDSANTWTINAANGGGTLVNGGQTVTFSEMENLNGAANNDDTFHFIVTPTVGNVVIDGLGQAGQDNVNLAGLNGAVSVQLGATGFNNIESITGNNSNSTLIGTNADNTWNITAENDGNVGSLTFIDFNNLTGGSGNDTFNLGADVTGVVDSGAGKDTFNLTANSTGIIDGNTGNDTFNINASGVTLTNLHGGADNDTLNGNDSANTWTINAANGGGTLVNGGQTATFAGMENLNGAANNDDTFRFTVTPTVGNVAIDGLGQTGQDNVDLADLSGAVSVQLGATGFNNIESITGNNSDSTLIGTDTDNTWNITAENDGNVGTLAFIDFNNLTGGSGNDTFNLGADVIGTVDSGAGNDTFNLTANATGIIDGNAGNDTFNINAPGVTLTDLRGGAGNDTLNGNDSANTWMINAANAGTLINGGQTVAFAAMENLNGAANNDDTFRFTVTPTVGNVAIDGLGQAGQDNVNLADLSGAVSVQLGATGFNNIESITGNNSNSILIGSDADNTWNITAENDGNVGSLTFIDFNNLTGGAGDDIFTFQAGGSLSGQLDGGIGRDRVDLSALTVVDVTLGQELVAIEQITGNNTDSILRGTTAANTFILTGANTGRLDDGLTFIDFNALDGGGGNDTFTFEAMGNLSGQLDGGTGTDSVDMSALATVDVTLGQGLANIERLTGNNTNSILRGTTGANTFILTGANDGTLDGLDFENFNNLDGGGDNDTFTFQTDGRLSGQLDGGAGTDSVDMSALVAVDVTLGQGLANIEQLIGNDSNSILRGTTGANTFILSGANDGTLDGLAFVDFNNLDGGGDNDTFTFQTGGSLSGLLDGGAGIDNVDQSALATVDVTLGQGLANIEQITGNNTDSILRGTNTANTFTLTGDNDGTLDGLAFVDFNNLDGGGDNDTFTFQASGSLSGRLDGGTGIDSVDMSALAVVDVTLGQSLVAIEQLTGNDSNSTLRGTNAANAFVLTGANTGTLDDTLTFSGFTVLNGGAGDDTFTFQANGSLNGLLDGGSGSDRVDLSQVTRTLRITQGEDINNIEILTGNDNSTLVGTAAANAFILSGENSGTLDNVLAFSRINRLHGGDGDDTFIFQADGRLTGLLDGGVGNDRADMSLVTRPLSVIQGQDIHDIEILNGNNRNSTLIGTTAANAFILSSENTGSLDDQLTFTGITALDGGDGDDTFTFQAIGHLSGLLAGGAGNDRVDLSQVTRALRITQGSDIDSIETLIGNNNGTLIGTTAANAFVLSGENAGTLDNNLAFSDFNQLDGGDGNDSFTFGANGRLTGLLDGGAGSDRVDLSRVTAALRVTQGTDIDNIETLTGNNNGVLMGTTAANAFVLSDENTGTLDASLSFTDFNQLDGGEGGDTFTFGANGRLTGLLDGGAGNDHVDMSRVTRALSVTQGSDINNIETLTGNNNGSLIGTTAANAFVLSGENTGRLDDQLAFSNFNQLDGGDGDDTFTFENNGRLSGLLEGGAGNDHVDMTALAIVDIALGQDVVSIEQITGNNRNSTLRGENNANTWILNGENSGNVDGVVFSGFTTLRGGNGDDRFSQGGFSGAIYGGDHITGDTIDYSNQAIVNVTVGDALAGSASIIAEIEGIKGNNTNSTLTGNTDNRNWFIDGENDGRVGALVFEDFNNLVGSDGDDTFTFAVSGRLSGSLNGGGGNDHADLSALDIVDITLGRDIINVEQLTGNNSTSTLRGADTNNTWMITGLNSGEIIAGGSPLAFSGFNNLTGGDEQDQFTVNDTGTLNGRIVAGAGDDSLSLTLAGAQSSQTVFDAGTGNDRLELNGGGNAYQETLSSVGDGGEFVFTNNGNRYGITYSGVDSIQDNVRAAMSVQGTAANDSFRLDANNGVNSITVNAATAVDYANKTDLAILGQGGEADRIILTGDLTIAGNVTLSAEQIVNDAGSRISASGLTLDGVNAAGTADARLLTVIEQLTLSDSGSVYLDEQNDLTIAGMNAAGAVDINAGGSVTSLGSLVSANGLMIASGGDIDLGQANQLSGPLTLSAASGRVALANAGDLNLTAVTATRLNLVATGNIDSAGAITVSGNTELNASGDIILSGDNDFSTLNATAANITLRDINVIERVDITATGSVDIGAQTGLGIGNVTADSMRLDAGAQGQLSDTNGNAVNLTGAQVVLRAGTGIGSTDALETQAADLDVINRTGTIALANSGAVTLSRLVTQGDIDFTNTGNVTLDTVDAGYNSGRLKMTVTHGSIQGVNRDYRAAPDVTAQNALINVSGDIGTLYRPVSVRVSNEFVLFSNVGSVYYYGGRPRTIIDNSTIKIGLFDALLGLSGQQLIDVETLSEIDPAIFTEVRHYTQDDISILLPADQRYDNDEEDEQRDGRGRGH